MTEYIIICPTCGGHDTVRAIPDGIGGDWVCEVCGYFFGSWIDDGELDLGISRIDPPGENNMEFFSEQFTAIEEGWKPCVPIDCNPKPFKWDSHTVEEPVDVAVGEVVEQEP